MDCKITFTSAKRTAAFTLTELIVAASLSLLALLAVAVLVFYTSRSFVAITNYVSLDQRSQSALDKMSKEIRQAHRLTDFSSTSITLQDVNNNPLQFTYEPASRKLLRVSAGMTNI